MSKDNTYTRQEFEVGGKKYTLVYNDFEFWVNKPDGKTLFYYTE